ncbi:MAG: endonuclease [Candidatus Cloacimonetes bacterium]|jgi:endonuclease I|nr:endonuclease [Candidatus Cloacimonadota bacterium]MDY0299341.1 endonuclease [Candidatus Cloacimonadaceae bacterium]MCK9332317.1 endonuclease [Candidatus Cloacimonadota bacterium]MDD2210892.1 endonuclease [Candidatus Cloacimonadota bacterium]MDD3282739.1 endonuclease [Candidatus Cloacimonadota bacterium]
MNKSLKILTTLCLLLITFGLWADYYDSVQDLSGMNLYYALQDLISTNTYSSYDGAKVFLFQDLDNTNGQVTCVYTGEVYHINSSYSGQTSPNTEHTYAQSWFSSSESSIKKADLHHLFITTMQVNSSRGNLPFGNVASTASSNVYYSHTPLQSYRGNNNWQRTVFQVNPQYQGNTARAILYFHTRYGDSLVQAGENMLDNMITWHYADPPDEAERTRNNALHGFQGNRNPFVDHPEYVNRIWNPTSSDDPTAELIPSLRIDNIYPNPFRDKLTVAIDAKAGEVLTAKIYNVKGQKVFQTTLEQNKKEFNWDAKDVNGKEMPAGLYLIKVSSANASASTKVLLVK